MYSVSSSISAFYYDYIELSNHSFFQNIDHFTRKKDLAQKIVCGMLFTTAFVIQKQNKLINCNCMFVGEKHVVVGHANYKECSVCGDHVRHGVCM